MLGASSSRSSASSVHRVQSWMPVRAIAIAHVLLEARQQCGGGGVHCPRKAAHGQEGMKASQWQQSEYPHIFSCSMAKAVFFANRQVNTRPSLCTVKPACPAVGQNTHLTRSLEILFNSSLLANTLAPKDSQRYRTEINQYC